MTETTEATLPTVAHHGERRQGQLVTLTSLCQHNRRAYQQVLEELAQTRPNAIMVSAEVAAELTGRWRAEDAERTAAEVAARNRRAEATERERLISEGLQLLSLIDQHRFDVAAGIEQSKYASADKAAAWDARIEQSQDDLSAALNAWSDWAKVHEAAAAAAKERAKNPTGAPPEPFMPEPPNWLEEERLRGLTAEREAKAHDERVASAAVAAYKRETGS